MTIFSRRPPTSSRGRVAALGLAIMAILGVLLVRLYFLQVVGADSYERRAEANRIRTVVLEAPRGAIVDRRGRTLVGNRIGEDVVIRPRDLPRAGRRHILSRLAGVLGVPRRELVANLRAARSAPYESVVVAEDVTPATQLYLAERRRDFPGVALRKTYFRRYPHGGLAAQLLGYVGQIPSGQERAYRRRGYLGNERVGAFGLEVQYELDLRGIAGEAKIEVDAAGEPVGRAPAASPSRPGRTLELTIDLPTQRALEAALREEVRASGTSTGAAGVALDPQSGEVLAMASLPTYRPTVFGENRRKAVGVLLADPARPLLNRAIAGLYPAGSTFKAITTTAALEGGYLVPGEVLESPGELTLYGLRFRGFEGIDWGTLGIRRALEVSSDTFFYQLGDRFYRDGSKTSLQDWARRFGLGRHSGIDLPGDSEGLVPDAAWKRVAFRQSPDPLDRSWKPGDSINLSIGQGNLLVTPLQMAVAYAAIANGGTLLTPSLGRRVLDESGRRMRDLAAGRPTRALNARPETLAVLRDGLFMAANGPDGTSTTVFGGLPERVRAAGKTGTAENPSRIDHSWYVGYAPASSPRIVAAVVVERGGQGANAAAPAVCVTMAAYLRFDAARCGRGAAAN